MIYTIKHSDWQWLIEPNKTGKLFSLKYKRPISWKQCKSFPSAQAAAEAVAKGETGIAEWDKIKHAKPFPSFSAWLIDPTGSAVTAISEILRTTVNPPRSPASGA